MDLDFCFATLETALRTTYTDEQVEFAKDFTSPVISFSDPGTGKTHSTIAGLIVTEMVHGINPKHIFACSFTREATSELAVRHQEVCKRLKIKSLVNFQTLDSLCLTIVKENYKLLSTKWKEMESISVVNSMTMEESIQAVEDIAEENELVVEPYKARAVVEAIRTLNSSLVFDRLHVESKVEFKKTGLSYEDFTTIRQSLYDINKILEQVTVGEITLYALEILTKSPELSNSYKERFKVMVVDEFQDMSLVKLHLLSLLTNNLVVVGDIKQQIYGFNGACLEIVQKYREYFPNHREVELTQSFRCANEIAEFSKGLIVANKMGGEKFKGVERENAVVEFHTDFDIESFVSNLRDAYVENGNLFEESVMFLYRNKHSAVPVIDTLYRYRIPTLVSASEKGGNVNLTGHTVAHKLPVIKDLCGFVELVKNPSSTSMLSIINRVIPEFKEYKNIPHKSPLHIIMQKENVSIFDVQYRFKDQDVANDLLSMLKAVKKLMDDRRNVKDIFNAIFPFYKRVYLNNVERYLEQPSSFYINLVKPLLENKTYGAFIQDEMAKAEFLMECYRRREGVRCLTFHGSKGTEATVVHVIDAEEGIIPNAKIIEDTLQLNCVVDAARDVRNERSLVYVAATRAKKALHIHYKKELASLFTTHNNYYALDKAYEAYVDDYRDVEVFQHFFSVEAQ